MKNTFLLLCVLLASTSAFATGGAPYPTSPDQGLTPGSLCDKPDSKRYPEGIPYCNRSVGGDLKQEVMRRYDAQLGFRVTSMERSQFKIDHYIPLCMGGSNKADNLWPQHQSIYVHTDPLEQVSCDRMAQGRLRQAEAVELIRKAKANPPSTGTFLLYVERL